LPHQEFQMLIGRKFESQRSLYPAPISQNAAAEATEKAVPETLLPLIVDVSPNQVIIN